jgi:glutathione synthase/RimK-type ligase-like ATP-grasp enzyme
MYKANIRTKNYSAKDLRGNILLPFRSIVRLGSLTKTSQIYPNGNVIECNTVNAIENSRDKLLMKSNFALNDIPQTKWFTVDDILNLNIDTLQYPIIAKKICGFKGHGMVKLDNKEALQSFINTTNLNGYYFEEFFNGSAEYRLHVSENGCFMAWRKLRKNDTPDDKRWYFNSDHCNWVGEDHELFNKPTNWDNMIKYSVLALQAVGLDIGSIDLRCYSPTKKNPDFKVIEINSAPSLGEEGIRLYKIEIARILHKKYNK